MPHTQPRVCSLQIPHPTHLISNTQLLFHSISDPGHVADSGTYRKEPEPHSIPFTDRVQHFRPGIRASVWERGFPKETAAAVSAAPMIPLQEYLY